MTQIRLLPPPSNFSADFPSKKATVIFILLLVLVLGALVWRWLGKYQWRLADFAPSSAWFYMELSDSPDLLASLRHEQPVLASQLDIGLRQTGLDQAVISRVEQLALVGLILDDRPAWLWLAQSPSPHELELVLPTDVFFTQLDDKTAAWSYNNSAVNLVRDSQSFRRPQPSNQDGAAWHGFVNLRHLQPYFKTVAGDLSQTMVSAAVTQLPYSNWQLLVRDGYLSITFDQYSLNTFRPAPNLKVTPGADLVFSAVTLSEVFDFVDQTLQQSQPDSSLVQLFSFLPVQLNHDQSWTTLFEQPVNLSLRERELLSLGPEANVADWLKTDWLVEFTQPLTLAEQAVIKNLARQLIAKARPVEREKVLPDNTQAVHLYAAPDTVEFTSFASQLNSSYLSLPEFDQEFILVEDQGRSLVSNSSSWLTTYLSSQPSYVPADCQVNFKTVQQVYLSNAVLEWVKKLADFKSLTINTQVDVLKICLEL